MEMMRDAGTWIHSICFFRCLPWLTPPPTTDRGGVDVEALWGRRLTVEEGGGGGEITGLLCTYSFSCPFRQLKFVG